MKTFLPAMLALMSTGCGTVCTQMYVPSGFAVYLEASSWATGDYELLLSGDVEASCAVTLPAEDTSGPWVGCDTDGVEISYRTHALDAVFVRDPLPEYLHVAVLLDGEEIAAQAFEPSYEITEPNGPGCGESINAGDTLTLN